jgi:hypothetical protein
MRTRIVIFAAIVLISATVFAQTAQVTAKPLSDTDNPIAAFRRAVRQEPDYC